MNKNRLVLFWYIGKEVYEEKVNCENIIKRYSDYYTYLFGNSLLFTRENVWFMKKFYLTFPIFNKKLNKLTWEQYKELLQINNIHERYFYFYISLFFDYNYEELLNLINNSYYYRI